MGDLLLKTDIPEPAEILTEDISGKKNYFIKGIFLQGNIKNRNGRIYPTDVLEESVANYKKDFIDTRRSYGELGHPNSAAINLERVSHISTEITRSGNDFIGKAKILATPLGNIAKVLIDEGCQLAVSSRGVGSINNDIVSRGYKISALVDIVTDPSAPKAFVQNLMEGHNVIWEESSLLEEDVATIYKEICKTKQQNLEKVILEQFNTFLSKIK